MLSLWILRAYCKLFHVLQALSGLYDFMMIHWNFPNMVLLDPRLMRVNEGSKRWQLEVLGSWQPSWSLTSDTVSSFAINFSGDWGIQDTSLPHEVINCPMDVATSASLHLASPYNVIQLNSRHTRQEKYFVRIKSLFKTVWEIHCLEAVCNLGCELFVRFNI